MSYVLKYAGYSTTTTTAVPAEQYRLAYSDYPGTAVGPPDPARWIGPPGPPGPSGPPGTAGPPGTPGMGGAIVGDASTSTVYEPLWWDSNSGQLFVSYDDGTSRQWVSANSIDASTLEGSFLPLTGGTLGNGADAPRLNINGAAGSGHGVVFQEAGITRFSLVSAAADRALHLYGYDTGGGYTGEALRVDTARKQLWTEYQIDSFISSAPPAGGAVTGVNLSVHNTGANAAYGTKVEYFSTAGDAGFDIALGLVTQFDPVFQPGVSPAHNGIWTMVVSPNEQTHPWGGCVGELNYVNRGPDAGFKRDRSLAGNNSGGLLFVPEANATGREGRNVGYGFAVSRSSLTNSTGFPVKTYIAFNAEPNSVVGLTGRAFYASGDITGVGSQYPYGPFQIEGTWLHGIDTTLATYVDGNALTLKAGGQDIAWIGGGTTAAPTGVATIGTFGSGTSTGLWLKPAASGYVATTTPLSVGNGTGSQTVTANGGDSTGFQWQRNGTTRYSMLNAAGDNLTLYSFDSGGAFLGEVFHATGTALSVVGRIGFNNTAPIAKPTGVAVTVAAVHAALVSYGLIAP